MGHHSRDSDSLTWRDLQGTLKASVDETHCLYPSLPEVIHTQRFKHLLQADGSEIST